MKRPESTSAGVTPELERVNLVLKRDDSRWLDELVRAIRERTGSRVSRSQIARAGLAALQELDRISLADPGVLIPLRTCKSGDQLAAVGILAVRTAALASRP